MRRSLLFKLMLCYIITISLIFMGANTIGDYTLNKYLTTNLYEQLNLTGKNIAHGGVISNYIQNNISTNPTDITNNNNTTQTNNSDIYASSDAIIPSDYIVTEKILTSYLQSICQATTYNIWILNKNGDFLYNSDLTTNKYDNINDYYNRFFYIDTNKAITIKNLVKKPSIFSINKIYTSDNNDNYLVLYTPATIIEDQLNILITIMNISLLLCSIIILIIFILIYFLTVDPIHKITNYAIEASQGKFNQKLNIHSNDECKDLANAVFYLISELNNIDEYQRNFISNISHDFRSPLTSIKGYLEAMLDGTIPPNNYNKYLNTILFEAERLTGLTTNLLTLNHLDNTKQLLNKTDFDINYIIAKTIDVYEGVCHKNKITLTTNFETEKQMVYADQAKIQQVINNILDNAIKFSPNNSTITLSTYLKVEKVFVSIKDHGQGIPKESIPRIWERFYKSDTSRGKDKKGTGLGLAITKEIINAHHENINVISTVGVGTEFSFSLPKSKLKDIN